MVTRTTWFAAPLALLAALSSVSQAQEAAPTITERQVLAPTEEETGSDPFDLNSVHFGAAIARHGDTLFIAEEGYPGNPVIIGRVAIFTRDANGQWTRTGTLDPPDGVSNPLPDAPFGSRIALSGNTALIKSVQGVYVYLRKRNQWRLVQKLHSTPDGKLDEVAVSRDWAFVSSRNSGLQGCAPDGSDCGEGVVHVYRVGNHGKLVHTQAIRSPSGVATDRFAGQLAFQDGRLLVGAAGDEQGRGAAYLFERRGGRWESRQKLVAIDGVTPDQFGAALAISDDWIAIGAPYASVAPDCTPFYGSGVIVTFRRIHGTWVQQQVVLPPPCRNLFGLNLALHGRWLAAGSWEPDGLIQNPLVFHRDHGEFTAAGTTAHGSQWDTAPLFLSGRTLFVGVTRISLDDFGEGNPGAVYVYKLSDTAP